MSKMYLVVRGFVNEDEICNVYDIKCAYNEINVMNSLMKNYSKIDQVFFFTTRKEADNIKRSIDEIIRKGR